MKLDAEKKGMQVCFRKEILEYINTKAKNTNGNNESEFENR